MRKPGQYRRRSIAIANDDHKLWHALLCSVGYEVSRDWDDYDKFFFDENSVLKYPRPLASKRLSQALGVLANPEMSVLTSDQKKISINKGIEIINQFTASGFRIGLALGVWDLDTPGHNSFLEAAKRVLGKNGKLIVGVAGSNVTAFIKGRKPVWTQDERVNSICAKASVDGVIPLTDYDDPKTIDKSGMDQFYAELVRMLAPHFRMIGDRDENFDLYCNQARAAGIGILVSDVPRITSTTGTIASIKSEY